MRSPLLIVFTLLLSSPMLSAAESDCRNVLVDAHRTEAQRARDAWRHPCATLAFFEVEPHHHVVEIWPGSGWYTEVLAPLLKSQGQLYAAHWSADSAASYFRKGRAGFDAKLQSQPEVYDGVTVTVLEPPAELTLAPEGSVDRVLSFRNVHSWLRDGSASDVLAAAHKALKPGGLLGIVQHRAAADTPLEAMLKSGYVTEAKVRELAETAGFEFVAASEVNANPADDRDHPRGVWTLPPSLALGETDRQHYLAIGESDRMTLKFRKPVQTGPAP